MPNPTEKTTKNKALVAILDGNAIIHRAFHALPPLTSKDGTLVNAVYGFATTLFKIIKDLEPTHLAVTFDTAKKTFRHEQFVDYKAQRVAAPQELYDQIVVTKKILEAMHIVYFEAPGFEADDIIGTLAKQLTEKRIKTAIITGDLDTLQLVNDYVSVHTFYKGFSEIITYTPARVMERFGFGPKQMIYYKALRGDPSDNIPGVPGVGEKTAGTLIKDFNDLDNLFKKLEGSKKLPDVSDKLKEKLLANKKVAYDSLSLVTINTEVPIKYKLDDLVLRTPDSIKTYALFQNLGFKSLLTRIEQTYKNVKGDVGQDAGKQEALNLFAKSVDKEKNGVDQKYNLIDSPKKLNDFIKLAHGVDRLCIDTETTDLNPLEADLLGISFCWEAGTAYYVDTSDKKTRANILSKLEPILTNPKISKVGHNIKYDYRVLQKHGLAVKGISDDSLIAAYLLSRASRSLKLDDLVFSELGYRMQPITDLIGARGKGQLNMKDVATEKISWYSCEDADYTWRLVNHFQPELITENLQQLYSDLEIPLIPVLGQMEQAGVLIDIDFLRDLSKKLHKEIDKISVKIHKLAGIEFNINSPQQMKEILFEKLSLSSKGLKKTAAGGGTSTAADELEKLANAHPIVPVIMQYRELNKLLTTYIDALPELVSPIDGRVHTSFNQAVAATGRLSSSDPNLQNIPIRSETGKLLRQAFLAARGFRLIGADYSQIELRVIASLAEDKAMLQAFRNGEDIHRRTAAAVFNKKLEEVTSNERRIAKEINFGIIYGLGTNGLAQRTGLPHSEAKKFIEQYFALHPHIKQWLDNTKVLANEQGYVQTLLGRKRYLPDLNSGVPYLKAAAERMAINMPIQGTAADLIKMAMINVSQSLPRVSPKARLILQVHDELIIEAPEADAETVAKLLNKEMESVMDLAAPIKAEVYIAKRWGEMKD